MPNKQKLKNKGNYVGNLTGNFFVVIYFLQLIKKKNEALIAL